MYIVCSFNCVRMLGSEPNFGKNRELVSESVAELLVILVEVREGNAAMRTKKGDAVIDCNFRDSSIVTETQQAMELKASNVESESIS